MIHDLQTISNYGGILELSLQPACGKAIRYIRQTKGLTQEELGFATGIQRKHISALEVGSKQPSLLTIFILAHGLRVKPSDLVLRIEHELLQDDDGG